jgi:hypothetical protein
VADDLPGWEAASLPPISDAQRREHGIMALLADRWRPPEFAAFAEMANSTGGAGRRIDFFAVACWASKGGKGHSIAVEVKISRSDFRRELKEPAKREFAWSVANECWFAVEKGVCEISEIPQGWGLMERTAAGLVVRRAAQQRDIEPWPAAFVAAFARRLSDPPPARTKEIYRFAGRDITEDDVEKLVADRVAAARERDHWRIGSDALAEYRRTHPEEGLILSLIRQRFGHDIKADRLAVILNGVAPGLTPAQVNRLRYAYNLLTSAMDEVVPVKA